MRHVRGGLPAELAPWVEHLRTVHWDLRAREPSQAETLPHPNSQLTLEVDGSKIAGIRRETRRNGVLRRKEFVQHIPYPVPRDWGIIN